MSDDFETFKTEVLEETFRRCVRETLDTPELMAQYRRLFGSKIGAPDTRAAIERMFDSATGSDPLAVSDEEYRRLFAFVKRCVWLPWLHGMHEEMIKSGAIKGKDTP